MPIERSAGAIIFRRDTKIKYLLLHYEAGHWDFPKGNIEEGEIEEETAKREVWEETGIKDIHFLQGFKEKIHYFYKKEGKTIYKEVTFFLAETKTTKVILSFEHIGYKWLSYDEAIKQLTYKTAKEVLKKAKRFLKFVINKTK